MSREEQSVDAAVSSTHIKELGARFHAWMREHPCVVDDLSHSVEELLEDAGVPYDRVVGRVKSWRSLKLKAMRRDPETGCLAFPDPLKDIHDIVGIRIITFNSQAIPVVRDLLGQAFIVVKEIDKTAQNRVGGTFGYSSFHVHVKIPDDTEDETLRPYVGLVVEIQIRTVLQHAWAEFEHDIRYKVVDRTSDPEVDRAFTLAAGLLELADQQFDFIMTIQQQGAPFSASALDAESLPKAIRTLVGDAYPISKPAAYEWLEELLTRNGISAFGQLRQLLTPENIDHIHHVFRYRFMPSQVRIVDDALLNRYGVAHIERTADVGNRERQRERRLINRLALLRADDTYDSIKNEK